MALASDVTLRSGVVNVRVPAKVGSLADAQKILANVLNRLGCGACMSGFDLRFTNLQEMVVDQKTLDVVAAGH